MLIKQDIVVPLHIMKIVTVLLIATTLPAMLVPYVVAFVTPQTFRFPWFLAQSSGILRLDAVPPGWVGGFAESKPDYAYPRLTPDLSDLPMLDNMANINKLTRQQKVPYPQFSWLAIPGDDNSRVYQMFAQNISRLGYTDDGRVYSIICPQQGFGTAILGTLNVEVTVTGQRGWVNEPGHAVYADLGVKGRIWISESSKGLSFVKQLMAKYNTKGFPFSKANSINVTTHNPGQPWNPVFSLYNGTDPSFPHPSYALHWDKAYGVGFLNVAIGGIQLTGNDNVDQFNQIVLDIFNLASGNILKKGSTLSWNVWFAEPELVDHKEWSEHAQKWRDSIDVNHTSPTGEGSTQTYFDGRAFKPLRSAFAQECKLLQSFLMSGIPPVRSPPLRSRRLSVEPDDEDEDDEKEGIFGMLQEVDFDRYDDK